ncbi:MAG: carboxypeptidase regulatory-like domain-containing protein [Deltaproteobacteria bacterium]|nr:carboxypeptidase regulatory-like domain-containing protein [Deltaproteobacteria bacterium]
MRKLFRMSHVLVLALALTSALSAENAAAPYDSLPVDPALCGPEDRGEEGKPGVLSTAGLAPYKSYPEVLQLLHQYGRKHPGLMTVYSIADPHPKTEGGNEIGAVRISKAPISEMFKRPVVYFNALQHAREMMSMEVALDIIQYLTDSYGDDAQVTDWIDKTDIWVVPVANPDGLDMIWRGFLNWRKNASAYGAFAHGNVMASYSNVPAASDVSAGVDLNRNYPYDWDNQEQSTKKPESEDYRGPQPASERETQNLMYFLSKYKPVAAISFHTNGELVLYPRGVKDQAQLPNETTYRYMARKMGELIPKDCTEGTYRYGEFWSELYSVVGTETGWMSSNLHTLAFVIELNAPYLGWQPRYEKWRDPTVRKARAAWKQLVGSVWTNSFYGTISNSKRQPIANAKLVLSDAGLQSASTASPIYEANSAGYYHFIAVPNRRYTLKVFADGYQPIVQDVVLDSRSQKNDFEMRSLVEEVP